MISLRNRLLTSYLLLLTITLGGIVLALLVTTGNQSAPPESTYQRLAPLARNLDSDKMIQDVLRAAFASQTSSGAFPPPFNDAPPQDDEQQLNTLLNALGNAMVTITPQAEATSAPPSGLPSPETQPSDVTAIIRSQLIIDTANTNNVRVIEFVVDRRLNNIIHGAATFDTLGTLNQNQLMRFRLDNWNDPLSSLDDGDTILFGGFVEDGKQWLFSGQLHEPSPSGQINATIVAEPRPTVSLQAVLANFGMSLILPLIQAALIGLLLAVALSVLISRTIAHPLQAAAEAALAVTHGDLSKRVPTTGPREVRAVAKAFNRMTEEVQHTQQAQQDFLANVSHDLKTPLTSIQGYSQAIMDGAARNPAQAAEIIYDEATRLTRLVRELTDLARIQAGQFPMKMTTIDLGEIISGVARKLDVVAQQKEVALLYNTAYVPPVSGDGDRLVQVLTNLISNAIKFTPQGGTVSINTMPRSGGVEVTVRDNGIGIPKDDLPRIFERFYQVDKTRGPGRGTGLGLAITYEIVQAHGGHIEVDSTEGVGTTFRVWFPGTDEPAFAAPVPVIG